MSTDFPVIPQKRLGDLCITLKLNIFYNMTQPGGANYGLPRWWPFCAYGVLFRVVALVTNHLFNLIGKAGHLKKC